MATSAARQPEAKQEAAAASLTKDDRRTLLRFMLLMRATEERALSLCRQGKVPGSFYDGRGQEATAVGPAFALGPRDPVPLEIGEKQVEITIAVDVAKEVDLRENARRTAPVDRARFGDADGTLLEIPAQDDSPPFFTMKKSRPDHVAEVLSVLVTPAPLEQVQITDKAQKLTDAQVASWDW